MKRRRFSLDVRPGAVALLAGLYLLLPLRWCARLALAVAVHELGHVAALVLCGAEIYGLRMEGCGLALRCAPPEGAVRTIAAAPPPVWGCFASCAGSDTRRERT